MAHVTTRQAIQIHFIPLADMPSAMRRLAEVGMTTREACGNTIRNMTACPLAGVCPKEHVDVASHVDGATAHFLRNPLNQQWPRKFKISFSGCEADCAQAMLHDCGLIAVKKDGQHGFRVRAGGGLGHKPRESV
ncbi:MAG: nitrite/sulfite reductase, partial [Gallionella sp.]|nr:nitrite/sulfite reductase [Gallionella sp.]